MLINVNEMYINDNLNYLVNKYIINYNKLKKIIY
jgi:hypothetical protein